VKYLRTILATDWKNEKSFSVSVLEKLLWFIPKANPGYENKMHLVKEWVVEFEDEFPCREIGLDKFGKPVLAGPSIENYGFWLDTNLEYSHFDGEEISADDFEKLWLESGVKAVT